MIRRPSPGPRLVSADSLQSTPLRIAVVGYGYWGPNLARNVIERPELELAGAVRARRRSAAAAFSQKVPGVPVFADLDDVLADPDDRRRRRGDAAAHPPRDRGRRAATPASTCWSRSRWRTTAAEAARALIEIADAATSC